MTRAAWLLVALSAASVAQGVLDVAIPIARHEPPFGWLLERSHAWGPWFLGAWLFVHNVGLAVLVPGVGFAAAPHARDARERGRVAHILVVATLALIALGAFLLLQRPDIFTTRVAWPLYIGESAAVLLPALAAARELIGPQPRLRALRAPLAAAVSALALLATVETLAVVRGVL